MVPIWRFAVIVPIATLAFAAQLTVAVADSVPRFNLEPVCRGIAQQGGLALEPNRSARQDFKHCMKSEMAMRGRVVRQWPNFTATEKADCIGEASAGGFQSYTDLFTCLQMAREARKLSQ